jgi:hypothetical protein
MDINSVSNSNGVYLPQDLPQKQKEQQNPVQNIKIQDKLDLSEEAKNIQNSTITQQKNLDKISERIKNNFYNSDEVTSKVADKIYQEITASN